VIRGHDAAWLGRALKLRLDRLMDELEGLAGRLAQATAETVGVAVAGAARDALAAVLAGPGAGRPAEFGRCRPGGRVTSYWDEPDDWGEDRRDGFRPDDSADYEGHLAAAEPKDPTSRWGGLLALACRAAGSWVRRHGLRHTALAALVLALLAALEQLVAGRAGLATSAVERLAGFVDAVRAASAALTPT
jgi:hypothetical protein